MPGFNPTSIELILWNALAVIIAACVFVPIFKRLGLGSILGFLAAGLAVKFALAETIAKHPEELLHFSEFGIVLFLFVIGLELKPATLWQMKKDIFGLGISGLMACGFVLSILALLFGQGISSSIIIGLGLALSSTAFVLKHLEENRERGTPHGQKAFSILLLQDLAIVPILLLIALLAPSGAEPGLWQTGKSILMAIGAISFLVLVGRYVLDHVFHLLSLTKTPEIMTASALGIVMGAALIMDLVGMSYAMGAFIAGLMLAESRYRHEVLANIEPFRGLLLGLFFMAVGLSLDLKTLVENYSFILLAAPLIMILKALAIYGVSRAFKNNHNTSVRVALALPQLGEFGFVVFTTAVAAGLMDAKTASLLIAIVIISLALSPLTTKFEKLFLSKKVREEKEEDYEDAGGRVLIIGFGRFGQIVSQPLFASGMDVTILDYDSAHIKDAEKLGFRVHFGDGSRRDVLRAAGGDTYEFIIVTIRNPDITDEIVELIKQEFNQAKIFARSYDRRHSIRLLKSNVEFSVRETFESALLLGRKVIEASGVSEEDAEDKISDVRRRDIARLMIQAESGYHTAEDWLHVRPVKGRPGKNGSGKTGPVKKGPVKDMSEEEDK